MIFDEKDRLAGVYISAESSRRFSSTETIQAMFSMNNTILEIAKEAIRAEYPEITEELLLIELRKRMRHVR